MRGDRGSYYTGVITKGETPALDKSMLTKYRKQAKEAANCFNYPREIIWDIEAAKTQVEIALIMQRARQRYLH